MSQTPVRQKRSTSVYLGVTCAFKTFLGSVENLAGAQVKQPSLCSINYITLGNNPNAGIMIDLFKPRTNKVVRKFRIALHNLFAAFAKTLESGKYLTDGGGTEFQPYLGATGYFYEGAHMCANS